MAETATTDTTQHDEALEAEMAAELGVPTGETPRDEAGRFTPAEPTKPTVDDKPAETEDAEFDPFMEEGEEPADEEPAEPNAEPDKANLAKKVEQQGYQLANLTKLLERQDHLLQKLAEKPTSATQQKAVEQVQDDAQAQLTELASEYGTDSTIYKLAKRLLTQQGKPDDSLRQELAQIKQRQAEQQAEISFDRQYPELAGWYAKAVAKAWDAADRRFPNAPDDQKVSYVAGKIHDLAEAAVDRIKARKSVKPNPQPSTRPSTSTKGARVASKSAARPYEQPVTLTVAEESRQWEDELQQAFAGH